MSLSCVFAFHCDANNIGDRVSSPARFIEVPNSKICRLDAKLPSADTLVLGGGAIFGSISKLAAADAFEPYRKVAAWGVSLPERNAWESVKSVLPHSVLVSTRDYGWKDVYDFVPCASCLSPIFDEVPPPSQEIVLYLHRKKTKDEELFAAGFPTMRNDTASLRSALNFIGSGEVVVTNSYHGVYWAQLLGRKVVCIPYGKKFFTYQDPPVYASERDWRSEIPNARRAASRLEEYRDINLRFFDKVFPDRADDEGSEALSL